MALDLATPLDRRDAEGPHGVSLHYSLDSLMVRGRRLFGWGFCLDTDSALEDGKLLLPLMDGRRHEVALLPLGYREDLVRIHPGVDHAGGAGFMVQAILPSPPAKGVATLRFHRAGEVLELALPGFPDAFAPPQAISLRSVWHRFGQIWRERGAAAGLVAAVRGGFQRLASLPQRQPLSAGSWPEAAVLVLDHGMGGGANRYRESRLAAWRAEGRPVVVAMPRASTLDFRIEIHDDRGHDERTVLTQEDLLVQFDAMDADVLEINSLVGFEDVTAMTAWAVGWRRGRASRHLRFNLHDFHSACPAFTLMDASGRFCDLPALERCRSCLPSNAISTLGLDLHRDVAAWRASWGSFLEACDHIAAFSGSSANLLKRAHPSLGIAPLHVEGHKGAGEGLRRVMPAKGFPVVVAVVGHLNRAKGADLLRELAKASNEAGRPLDFVLFGTLEGGAGGHRNLRVLGSYTRDTLCDRLEAERVALALLPSVCPETYSYVTDELMATGLPLAVLDRGAPAERVLHYPLGRVLDGEDPASLLEQLVAFAAEQAGEPSNGSTP